eukprot:13368933-Ditylum_brightwellii.AAC.1
MEPSRSSAPAASANESTSAASTQHLNSSIGEENALEMACGNRYGIGYHGTRSTQEQIFQAACASAARLGCVTFSKSDTVGFQSGNKTQ